jgi:hypothetical protein
VVLVVGYIARNLFVDINCDMLVGKQQILRDEEPQRDQHQQHCEHLVERAAFLLALSTSLFCAASLLAAGAAILMARS